ncbi:MAG TPA: hypothetical protein VLC95_11870 [Anaerolineae bacterium]|nr:hypothetical protein [Anaerolineae bacterium]
MKRVESVVPGLVIAALVLGMIAPGIVRAQAGTGPEDALTVTEEWRPLQAGKSLWHGFYYDGDGSEIRIRLDVEPPGGAGMAVWTPEGIERRALGLAAEPVGRGSPDPSVGGSLLWVGGSNRAGTYYAVVESGSPSTVYYLLGVEGIGVSRAPTTPAPSPAPPRATPRPRPTAPAGLRGKLVFQASPGGPLYVIDVARGGLRRIANGMDPVWSPDGTEVAFTRWDGARGVWVVNADGTNARRVFDWNEARWPSWSPDGGEIVFARQHGGRMEAVEECFWGFCFTLPAAPEWHLGIVSTGDGSFREPATSPFSRAPAWSPDGSRFVYSDEDGLHVQSVDGATSYAITDDSRDTSPAWSPDGTQVAFTRRQHDHLEVYVVDADGRNLKRLTVTRARSDGTLAHSASPAWSPDGAYLAFVTDRSGAWEIWVMETNGNRQRLLFDEAPAGIRIEYGFIGDRVISWGK